jgi:hypothetical protein
MTAAFLFKSALAHFLISTPGIYNWYIRNLKKASTTRAGWNAITEGIIDRLLSGWLKR